MPHSYTSQFVFTAQQKLPVSYIDSRFKSTIQNLLSNYINTLSINLEKSNNTNDKEFTPSDFEAADISMEDLNSLFNGE